MKEKIENKKIWYDNSSYIINLAIGFIIAIIILSQAYAVKNGLTTTEILRNVLNHNILYLMGLIYFIPIKTKVGKRYFNYFNVFFIIIYLIFTTTSLLTVVQSFGIVSLMNLTINLIFLIYMSHNLLKNTKTWKELKMNASPFYEISNDGYFNALVVLSIILLAINLIASTTFDGVILSLLATLYNCLLARYIYLYQIHLEHKEEKDLFTEIDHLSKDLPKLKTVAKEVSNKELNNYQKMAIVIFMISFIIGIIFGNIFPTCSASTDLYRSTCSKTEFNFSLTLAIWSISFLICALFYGMGEMISLLESINTKLDHKPSKKSTSSK